MLTSPHASSPAQHNHSGVLLLGDERNSCWIRPFLKARGCRISSVLSIERDVIAIPIRFRLILNVDTGRFTRQALSELDFAARDIFSAFPVENGAWWLPVVRNGRRCLEAPALRSGEFGKLLDRLLREQPSSEEAASNPHGFLKPLAAAAAGD